MKIKVVTVVIMVTFIITACSHSGKGVFHAITGVVEVGNSEETNNSTNEADNVQGNLNGFVEENQSEEELSGQAIFDNTSYKQSDKITELSEDVTAYQIQINDCIMEFPMDYSMLLAKGWSVNTLYGNDTSPLKSDCYTVIQFMRDDKQLGFLIYNPDITVRKVKDCVVAGVEVNLLDYSEDDVIILPGDIRVGVTGMDEVLEIMGEPGKSKVFEAENVKVDYLTYPKYESSWSYDMKENSQKQLTFKNGILVDVEMVCFEPTKSFVYSKGNPDIVPEYDTPSFMTENITDNIVCFAGDLYQLPVPVYVLLENGWKINDNYSKLDEGTETTIAGNSYLNIYFERDGVIMYSEIQNIHDEAIIACNALVYEMGEYFYSNTNVYGERGITEVSGGISLGMSEEALVSLLENADIEYEKKSDTQYTDNGNEEVTLYRFYISEENISRNTVVCKNNIVVSICWNAK